MSKNIRKISKPIALKQSKKRVAAYARVSSEKEAMLHSLSAQISYYSSYIQNNPDWEYVGVYADKALTGTKDERPKFQKLLNDCTAGKIDMIITKTISRFARNTVTLLTSVRQLKEMGIDVYFEKQGIHSLSGEGEMVLTLLASVAQEESRAVSENCKWRIRNRFKNGELVNLRFMYGYWIIKGKITINPEEAEIVKMIFDAYIAGEKTSAISKRVRESKSPTCYGGSWSDKRVTDILKNEKYTGNSLLQKSYVVDHLNKNQVSNNGVLPKYYAEETHDAIIDIDTFNKAQKKMAQNRERFRNGNTPGGKYPFSGMIVCEGCGKKYKRKVKPYNVYWICSTFNSQGKAACASKQIPDNILKELTASVLKTSEFDENIFKGKIREIRIPAPNIVKYIFRDNSEIIREWKDRSRSDSWTDEMKMRAKNRMKNSERR